MNKKRYKDLLAFLILLGVIGVIVGAFLFAFYASDQAKHNVMIGIICSLVVFVICVTYWAIRIAID